MRFDDDFDDEFDRRFEDDQRRLTRLALISVIASVAITLALLGVVVWGFVRLVNQFT